MGERKNLKITAGYRFGKLTVLEATEARKGTSVVWKCRCECGNEIFVDTARIRKQAQLDCGCESESKNKAVKYTDLTGQRFGKLIILEATEKRADQGSVVWRCRCDCGNETETSARRLTRGKVRSCGCLSNPPTKDYIGKRFGRLTVLECAGKIGKNNAKNYWKCRCDCGKEVTVGQTELQNGETQSCGCYQKECAKEALELFDGTSIAILERTKEKLRTSNKSGYTGVFWDKRSKKWIVRINFKKKSYWLGSYDEINEAIKARQRGEEMRDNFLEWYYAEFRIGEAYAAEVEAFTEETDTAGVFGK